SAIRGCSPSETASCSTSRGGRSSPRSRCGTSPARTTRSSPRSSPASRATSTWPGSCRRCGCSTEPSGSWGDLVIDAYAHCGVSKYLPVEQVRSVMDGAGIERAVLCQHLGEYDNTYLESVVRAEPDRFTAVALVDGIADGWRRELEAVAETGAFRGLRL